MLTVGPLSGQGIDVAAHRESLVLTAADGVAVHDDLYTVARAMSSPPGAACCCSCVM